jgi:ABC-type polysaccharide/polyol phosphate transport system ATPase subunit
LKSTSHNNIPEKNFSDDEIAVKVENVSMIFNLSSEKVDNIKEYVIKLVKRELFYQEFWALKNVSFQVKKGEKLGIIGLNGAGKSTLLKLISGVMKPTKGKIEVNGGVVPLLELGGGFNSNYTGRENIFLRGALLGYSKSFMESKFDEIVEFSELGDFIDVPVKNYSSGMTSRLGFSISTIVQPQILILDEVLAVGDAKFRQKSQERMNSFLNKNTTVLMVSHSMTQVKDLCDRAIWLENGELIMDGPVDEVCDSYLESVGQGA